MRLLHPLMTVSIHRYKGLAAGIAGSIDARLSAALQAGVANMSSMFNTARAAGHKLPDAATAADRILTVLGEYSPLQHVL